MTLYESYYGRKAGWLWLTFTLVCGAFGASGAMPPSYAWRWFREQA